MLRKQSWVGGGQDRKEGKGKRRDERNLIHPKREKEGGGREEEREKTSTFI